MSKSKLLLGFFMLLYVLVAWKGAVHLDLARDTRIALDIIDGNAFPILGPSFAHQFHLGPVWYYLLALLHLVGGGWLGATILLYLLASLQFPLAYLAGKALQDRSTGLLWAGLLLIPSWSTFEQVLPTHTLLTTATLLATLLGILRFLNTRKRKYLLLAALGFSLSLHAHPSAVVAIVPLGAMFIHGCLRGSIGLKAGAAAILLAAIPFLPFLIDQWRVGFDLADSFAAYNETNRAQIDARNILAVSWQVLAGGTQYWLQIMLELNKVVSWLLIGLVTILAAVGLLGLLAGLKARNSRHAWVLISLLLGILILVALRNGYPYYYTTALRVMVLGGISFGFIGLLREKSWPDKALPILLFAFVGAYSVVIVHIFQWQSTASLPYNLASLFNVKSAWPASAERVPHMSIDGMAGSGSWLCDHEKPAIHGSYSVHLLHAFALETRGQCPPGSVLVGGDEADREHWIGLSRRLVNQLGRNDLAGPGGYVLLPANAIHARQQGIRPEDGGYPPIFRDISAGRRTVEFRIDETDEHVAISNFAFAFLPYPKISASCGDSELSPVAGDAITRIYANTSCRGQAIQLEITTTQFEYIDVVSF